MKLPRDLSGRAREADNITPLLQWLREGREQALRKAASKVVSKVLREAASRVVDRVLPRAASRV